MKEEKKFFSDYKEQIKDALDDLKTKGRRHKQIPNILSTLRLAAPALIIPASIVGNIPFVIGATIFFGLTDMADGFIARRWELRSKLGADLDALADKLFAGTLLLAGSITNPLLLVNVALEMAIAGINLNQKAKGNLTASTFMGKVKTCALFALVGAGILSSVISPLISGALFVTSTILQGLTIKSYLNKYNKNVKHQEKNKEQENETFQIEQSVTPPAKNLEKKIELKQNNGMPTVLENPEVERLREMRDFLTAEKERRNQPAVEEKPKVYKKD